MIKKNTIVREPCAKRCLFPHQLLIWLPGGTVSTGGMHIAFESGSSFQMNVICFIQLQLLSHHQWTYAIASFEDGVLNETVF